MGEYFDYSDEDAWEEDERPPDPKQGDAREAIRRHVDAHRGHVFYSRQLQILMERDYFHWITNRAMQDLINEGYLLSEDRRLKFGGTMKLLWHHKDRNVRRELNNVAALVEEFSDPSVGESLGWVGEHLVLEAFVRNRFLLEAREAKEFNGVVWRETGHDLDFIFSRDGVSYGVEVKNKLGYIDDSEFQTKIRLAQHLGVRPVFACRSCPQLGFQSLCAQVDTPCSSSGISFRSPTATWLGGCASSWV
jgi:hypothetical protein